MVRPVGRTSLEGGGRREPPCQLSLLSPPLLRLAPVTASSRCAPLIFAGAAIFQSRLTSPRDGCDVVSVDEAARSVGGAWAALCRGCGRGGEVGSGPGAGGGSSSSSRPRPGQQGGADDALLSLRQRRCDGEGAAGTPFSLRRRRCDGEGAVGTLFWRRCEGEGGRWPWRAGSAGLGGLWPSRGAGRGGRWFW